jgi:hypothetical protein
MLDIRALLDGVAMREQFKRAGSQMTLGTLIDRLSELPGDLLMWNMKDLHSYRGYYSDLAFDHDSDSQRPVREVLADCRKAMGEVFVGYKGGDFVMGRNTPMWISSYGSASGLRLMAVEDDGGVVTKMEDEA